MTLFLVNALSPGAFYRLAVVKAYDEWSTFGLEAMCVPKEPFSRQADLDHRRRDRPGQEHGATLPRAGRNVVHLRTARAGAQRSSRGASPGKRRHSQDVCL